MAWMTREDGRRFTRMPNEPDMETLTYWVTRLEPLIRSDNTDEIIVVFCNRAGSEDDAIYAGTSAVIGIQDGEVKVYGLLGRGEKELLVIDTNNPPHAKMVYRPELDGNGRATGSLEKHDPNGDSGSAHPDKSEKKDDASKQSPGPKPDDGQQRSPNTNPPSESSHSASSGSGTRKHASRTSGKDAPARGRSPKRHSPSATSDVPSLPPLPALPSGFTKETPKRRQAPPITIPTSANFASLNGSAKSPGSSSFNIPTPSAPSPTPMAIRPRLIIPESSPIMPYEYPPSYTLSAASERSEKSINSFKSDESEASVQTVRSNPRPPEESTPYPDSGAPLSGYPSNYSSEKVMIYGGHVTISHTDGGFSPTTPFEDMSPVSAVSRMFWRPSDNVLRTPLSAGAWTPGTPIGRRAEPFPWPMLKGSSRPSSRPPSRPHSRNDAADRSKDNATPQELRHLGSQSPQSNTSSNKTRRSGSSQGTSKATREGGKRHGRPSSPKSRNASRSRMHERPESALSRRDSSAAITQHLENISQRAESVNKMRGGGSINGTPIPDRPQSTKSRNCSQSRPIDYADSDHHTISIAASPSILDDGAHSALPDGTGRHRSVSRLGHQRSNSATLTNGNHLHMNFDRSGTPGSAPGILLPASRATSRGRQPGPKDSPTKSEPTQSHPTRMPSTDSTRTELLHHRVSRNHSRTHDLRGETSSSHSHASRSGRRPSQGHDTTNFERVEVIVCPSCPAHGRRSSSTVGHSGHTPVQGSVAPPPTDDGSGDDGVISPGPSTETEKTPVAPKDPSAFTDFHGQPVNEGGDISDYSSSAETMQTVSTPGRSPATPAFFNPTTPRAMVFSPEDTMDSFSNGDLSGSDVPSARCAETDKVSKVELPRGEVA